MQSTHRTEFEKKLFVGRIMNRIFNFVKSLQKDNLSFKMRHKETNREVTTDETKAELMNNYSRPIVSDESFNSFYRNESRRSDRK